MVHRPRIQFSGAIHHVTTRGSSKEAIFRVDPDYSVFVATLAETTSAAGWRCLAYCLMPNHYHLMIETPQPTLSEGMHRLNGTYAARFNTAHARGGHVFESRFRAQLIKRDEHLLEAFRYVVLNPVRASLVPRPERWRWSSYRATAGLSSAPPWLASERVLGFFGESRRAYRQFVAEGIASGTRPRPSLADLVTSRSRAQISLARHEYGYTQSEIAAHLGISQPTISRILRASPRE
jgi:putative transposase